MALFFKAMAIDVDIFGNDPFAHEPPWHRLGQMARLASDLPQPIFSLRFLFSLYITRGVLDRNGFWLKFRAPEWDTFSDTLIGGPCAGTGVG